MMIEQQLLPEFHVPAYRTQMGAAYCADSLDLLAALPEESIDLVMTSPPFALLREKTYGNRTQEDYVAWLAQCGWRARWRDPRRRSCRGYSAGDSQ